MSQAYLELAPISDKHPTGRDVRYEQDFEQLQAEIDKLSLPSSEGGVNWERVQSLASKILKTKSKDLLVASFFVVAKAYTEKQAGLASGLHVLSGLLENYWDDLFPVKKRMRGRQAAITWLLEKIETALDRRDLGQISPDIIDNLYEELCCFDLLLEKHFGYASIFNKLRWIIDDSSVTEIPGSEKFPDVEAGNETPRVQQQDQSVTEYKKPSNQSTEQTTERDGAKEQSTGKVESSPALASASIDQSSGTSGIDIEKNLRSAFLTVKTAAKYYFDNDLIDPKGYRLRRLAGWTMIQTLPSSTDDLTEIPLPSEFEQIKQQLETLRSSNDWQSLLKLSEDRLQGSILWLDLNRYSAEGLAGLGSRYQDAHDAVSQETMFLLTRLPGLEKLKYADGSPLADPKTREWLENLTLGAQPQLQTAVLQTNEEDEQIGTILKQAQQLAVAKKIPEAVNLITGQMQQCSCKREGLTWRLCLAQLLSEFRLVKFALPHLDEIVKELEEHKLESWDPLFTANALKVVWNGYKQDKSTKDKADHILACIAKLDPVGVLHLEKK